MFGRNDGEFLFQSGGLDRQIEWNHLLLTGPKKKRKWRSRS